MQKKIKKLNGEDLRHFLKKHKAYYVTRFDFENNHNIDDVILKIKNTLPYIKKISNDSIEIINNPTVENKSELLLGEINNYEEIFKMLENQKYMYLYGYNFKKKWIYIAFNHSVVDGSSAVKYIESLFDSDVDIYQKEKIIISKKQLLGGIIKNNIIKTFKFSSEFNKQEYYNFDRESKSNLVKLIINSNIIYKIKNKYDISFNSSISFYLLQIINCNARCATLTNTEIYNNKNYNSYGIIPFIYKKHYTPKDLDKNISDNKMFSIITPYMISKFSKFLDKKYKDIDIIFSSIPFTKNTMKMCNKKLKAINFFMPNHSVPIYIFSLKSDDKLHLGLHIKDTNILNKVVSYFKKYDLNYEL